MQAIESMGINVRPNRNEEKLDVWIGRENEPVPISNLSGPLDKVGSWMYGLRWTGQAFSVRDDDMKNWLC